MGMDIIPIKGEKFCLGRALITGQQGTDKLGIINTILYLFREHNQ